MSETPTVVIVDDHRIFRSGVRAELGEAVEVLGEAESIEDAVRAITELEPDVVLLDVHMPGGGGVEVIGQVSKARPQQRFLALSVSDDPQDVIAIVRAGARGYVTKTITGDELADAVRRVRDGDAVFSPRLAGFVLDAFAGDLPAEEVDPELDQLTAREREVLRYIARGYLYKEIAPAPQHLGEDRRGPRQLGAAQAAALEPARAQPLGGQPAAGRLSRSSGAEVVQALQIRPTCRSSVPQQPPSTFSSGS